MESKFDLGKIKDSQVEHLIKYSSIPKQYFKFSWDDYKVDDDYSSKIKDKEIISSRKKAKIRSLRYCEKICKNNNSEISLIIYGKKKSGKTVLATLILREFMKRTMESVLFVPFPQFATESNTANLNDERERFEEKYIDPSLLCLDEVTEMDSSPKIRNYFGYILSERKKLSKPTIITSKITDEEIRKIYGELVYDIISDQWSYAKINIETSKGDILKKEDIFDESRSFNITMINQQLSNYRNVKKTREFSRMDSDNISGRDLYNLLVKVDKECR